MHVSFSEWNHHLNGYISAHWLPDDGVLCVEFADSSGHGETRLYRLEEVDQ